MIPLSTKMRTSTLDGFVGQTHFLFEGSLFYNSIKNKKLFVSDCEILSEELEEQEVKKIFSSNAMNFVGCLKGNI